MAYTTINFKTKAELRRAVKAGQQVTVYQPNADLTGAYPPSNGTVFLEGPHYPSAHSWYAEVVMKDGFVFKVK